MRHRSFAAAGLVASFALLSTLAVATPAYAQPVGDDVCINSPRQLPVTEFTDHRELGIELNRIEQVSDGVVDVEEIGRSNRGREIWSARVGTGPTAVLLTSEIHGNEKVGTDAVLQILDYVGTSDSPEAQQWRDELTIVAVPKMNPDGAELDRRGNDQTWEEVVARFPQLTGAEPAWNYYTTERGGDDYAAIPGFDTNRDYHPDLNYVPDPADFPGASELPGFYITPEAQLIRDVYRGLQAEFGEVNTYVDVHHQGACYVMPEDPDQYVTLSISGQFVADPATKPGYEQYAEAYDLDYSKQLNVAINDALQEVAEARNDPFFGAITLYPQDIDLPGTGLGSFALNGSGTVLFEIRGQTQTLGQELRTELTEATYIGLEGMLDSIASGEVETLDPAEYDVIPPRGPNIGVDLTNADPRLAEEDPV